ncbi:MAG: GntR family transcriptional regulator [Opitutaceae bacterium]|jgi:DNA-binding GntR family transcriptional regulator|nr:GntR family transcriptional regulator [Opitutaceae bacterium]
MKDVNSDIAYKYIRKGILDRKYPPGYPLMTKDLAEVIGVSRTPVRDALRQLETDGLVSIRPNRGARVKQVDLNEFREICELRLALETYAAGLAAHNRTPVELQEMRACLARMQECTDQLLASEKEPQEVRDKLQIEDIRFHVAIINSAKNQLMKKEVLRLHVVNRVVASPILEVAYQEAEKGKSRRAAIQKCHDAIYHAIERGDVHAARTAMEEHIQDIIDNLIKVMAQTEPPPDERALSEEELSYVT